MDMLGSAASVVAILTVLWSWYKNAQSPLVIDRVVIHKKEAESTYIINVKNRKPYPVEIKSTHCYKKRQYKVHKKINQNPEYTESLNYSDSLFFNSNVFEIGANGHTDIRIIGAKINEVIPKLLFAMHTSRGYHEIWCKNLHVVNLGSVEVFSLDHDYDYDSKIKAKAKYYWLFLRNKIKIKTKN